MILKNIKILASIAVAGALVIFGLLLFREPAAQVSSESRFKAEMTTKITTNATTLTIVHSHDGLPLHKHVIVITTTVNETTFPAGLLYGIASTVQLNNSSTLTSTATQNANEIRVTNGQISPVVLSVAAGSKVVWTSKDTSGHTITSDSGIFNGFLAPNNGIFSFTFEKPGTYTYYCELNAGMKGTIIVNSPSSDDNPGINNTAAVNALPNPIAGINGTTTIPTLPNQGGAGSGAAKPVHDGGYVSE